MLHESPTSTKNLNDIDYNNCSFSSINYQNYSFLAEKNDFEIVSNKLSSDRDILNNLSSTFFTTYSNNIDFKDQDSFFQIYDEPASPIKEYYINQNNSIDLSDLNLDFEENYLIMSDNSNIHRKASLYNTSSFDNYVHLQIPFVDKLSDIEVFNQEELSKHYVPCIFEEEHYESYVESTLKGINLLETYFNSTAYSEQIKTILEKVSRNESFVNSPLTLFSKDKKTLVLDLDETLVRCEPIDVNKTYNFTIEEDGFGVFYRKGMYEFLSKISSQFW